MCHLVDPWLVLLGAIYSQMITLWGWPLQLIMRGLLIPVWHWTRKDISSIHHELLDASESDCTSIITYIHVIFWCWIFGVVALWKFTTMCASFWPLGSLFMTFEASRGIPTRWAPVLQIPQLSGGSKGRANTRSLAAEASWLGKISGKPWINTYTYHF